MKTVLLDRDGTVIVDPPDLRVDKEEKIELFDDSIEALKYLADNGFEVILITNQAGIEEGRLTEEDFWRIHNEVLRQLSPSGINFLKTYMNGEMKRPDNSDWRKPGPKMLLQAAEDFNLDLSHIYIWLAMHRPTSKLLVMQSVKAEYLSKLQLAKRLYQKMPCIVRQHFMMLQNMS